MVCLLLEPLLSGSSSGKMPTIEELEQDTASLEYEISQLQRKKADLLKEIEKAKRKDPLSASFSQLKALLKSNAKQTPKKRKPTYLETVGHKRRSTAHDDDYNSDYLMPNPVTHEYFDKSIAKYFQNDESDSEQQEDSSGVIRTNAKESLSTLQKSENVLLENIYRMFGITAFPVKKPNSTPESQELLGIRIEIFNSTDLVFETPHYLILQKNLKNSKWDIYKHTIPNFIQVKTIAAENYDNLSEYQLFHFIMEIRDILNKVAIKHQIIDKLKRDLSKNVKNLEKDIPLEVLKFDLKIPNQVVTPVILNLSLESIESSYIERGFSETEKSRINNVLKGDIKSFQDRLHDVINSVSE